MTSPSPSPSSSPSPSDEESSPRAAKPSAPVREVLRLLSQNPLPLETSYRDWKFLLGLQLIYQSLFLWRSISPAPAPAPATISPLDVDDSEFDPFDGHWWDPVGSSQMKDNKRVDYACSCCSARKTMFIKYHGDHSHENGEAPVGGDHGCGGKRILK